MFVGIRAALDQLPALAVLEVDRAAEVDLPALVLNFFLQDVGVLLIHVHAHDSKREKREGSIALPRIRGRYRASI